MFKTLLRPFLGKGKFPAELLVSLQAEGVEFLEEGMWATITFINYRDPHRWSSWKKQAFAGAIALTFKRIVAYGQFKPLLDLPYDHPKIKAVDFKLEKPDYFYVSFKAEYFHTDRSGIIELRFSTLQAAQLLERLDQKTNGQH